MIGRPPGTAQHEINQSVRVVGTRRVTKRGPIEWRVVCKDCGTGGVVRYMYLEDAVAAAHENKDKFCVTCRGAGGLDNWTRHSHHDGELRW